MNPTTLNLTDAAAAALDSLPSRTKASFASAAVIALHEMLGKSLEILAFEPAERQAEVVRFSRLAAEAFGANALAVLAYDRERVEALLLAHGMTFCADLTNAGVVLAQLLDGSPRAFEGMLDPMMTGGPS